MIRAVLTLVCAAGLATAGSLDSLFQNCLDQYHIPGIAACAVRADNVVWSGSYGYARLEDRVQVTDTTVFNLASVSKTATAAALMQLWEAGLFGLDDDVSDHLPFQVRHSRFPDSAITFRQLLTHTSGIIDYWPTFEQLLRQGDPDVPLRAFVEGYLVPGGEYYDSLHNFAPWPPGLLYTYSNMGIALAGYLVQALADSFHHFTRDSLFLPLEMNRTVWYFADIDTNTMAMPYRYTDSGFVRYGHQSLPDVPAGTMKSSASELGHFLAAMLGYGTRHGVRVLDSSTVALMTTVQPPSNIGLVWHPGYVGSRPVWCHGGAWNGISTWIGFCREDMTGAVVLCNVGGAHSAIEGVMLPALFDLAAGVSDENPAPLPSRPATTICRGTLHLPPEVVPGRVAPRLVDVTGRTVMELRSGQNDVAGLGSGCYFILSPNRPARRVAIVGR